MIPLEMIVFMLVMMLFTLSIVGYIYFRFGRIESKDEKH